MSGGFIIGYFKNSQSVPAERTVIASGDPE